MALPNTFGTKTGATGGELDQNFAALGAITTIFGVVAGTNAITLTPATNNPTVSAYQNGQSYGAVLTGTNTSATTFRVNALAALPVYRDTATGPVALSGGEAISGNYAEFQYDSALNGGAGGFHLRTGVTGAISVASLQVGIPGSSASTLSFMRASTSTITFGGVPGANTSISSVDVPVSIPGVTFGDNTMVSPLSSVQPAGISYSAYVTAANIVMVRATNATNATQSLSNVVLRVAALRIS